jgi:predicted small lipoprotein YifL
MNLKLASVVLALLSLPLAGCGNKGPLVLPQTPPPAEEDLQPSLPPMDDATAPIEGVSDDVPPPADDTVDPATPPPPDGDDGNG